MQRTINVKDLVKSTLKIKGTIDVSKSTENSLKKLESFGVQTNVLIATILDGYDLESFVSEFENESENSKKNESLEQ